MSQQITANMISAVKVQWLKPIFEDDFPERGMKAWLVAVEWQDREQCYLLWFDFTEFEAENEKYMCPVYYGPYGSGEMLTAREAGYYKAKYSVYFSAGGDIRDDEAFAKEIVEHLQVI